MKAIDIWNAVASKAVSVFPQLVTCAVCEVEVILVQWHIEFKIIVQNPLIFANNCLSIYV